ncbi:MAG: MBL fold metallo-hydrolase [bacterium]|nr:MBL fold metallo-hydrolase [bacterium]
MQRRGDDLFHALQSPSSCRVRLWRLGGAGIAIQYGETLLYIDPFVAPAGGPGWIRCEPPLLNRLPPAQLVLLTHEHDDHADPVALSQLAQSRECMVVAPAPAAAIAEKAGFDPHQIKVLSQGQQAQAHGFTITALPVIDTDSQGALAYLIEVNDVDWRLYHGGDAHMSPLFEMAGAQHRIDCACLSAAGTNKGIQYYLTPAQTVQAAQKLGARSLIPVHWDLWTINALPESVWRELRLPPHLTLHVLQPGEVWCPDVNADEEENEHR